MITFDAMHTTDDASPGAIQPRLFGHRITDLSATVGGAVWLAFVAGTLVGPVPLTVVELFVALALLTLVPLGLGLAATPRRSGGVPFPYRLAVVGQLPAALVAVVALAFPVCLLGAVALLVPWLGLTGTIAAFGLWRLGSRGLGPVPELAIDAALLYVPVGAVALLLHVAGISLRFRPIIILLTGVHYHYAGFVLPLVTGVAGRILAEPDGTFASDHSGRVAAATTLVIVVNLALIAIGITFSPLVEVVAAALFAVAVAGFAILILWQVVPTVSHVQGALLTVASLAIIVTMALACAYGYSAFPTTPEVISIGGMIRWHGSLNAFGFALPALLALRLADTD